jgi:hypothetical protein
LSSNQIKNEGYKNKERGTERTFPLLALKSLQSSSSITKNPINILGSKWLIPIFLTFSQWYVLISAGVYAARRCRSEAVMVAGEALGEVPVPGVGVETEAEVMEVGRDCWCTCWWELLELAVEYDAPDEDAEINPGLSTNTILPAPVESVLDTPDAPDAADIEEGAGDTVSRLSFSFSLSLSLSLSFSFSFRWWCINLLLVLGGDDETPNASESVEYFLMPAATGGGGGGALPPLPPTDAFAFALVVAGAVGTSQNPLRSSTPFLVVCGSR